MLTGFADRQMGLLGEKLGHSFSALIHPKLGDYSYKLMEVAKEDLAEFLEKKDFAGLNVTIPYKKQVMQYLDYIDPMAKKIGAVNTIKRADGSLAGYNTDYAGFKYLLKRNGINIEQKKVLVLGSGGASAMIICVLEELGAKEIVVISRQGENNYHNLFKHYDAQVIINATPVGMYPQNYNSPVDISLFPKCESVVDIIYNPLRTKLIVEAMNLGLKTAGGLEMLVIQAAVSAEIWCEETIEETEMENIIAWLTQKMQNIVLIGMPGSGKTTIAKMLAQELKREMFDMDEVFSEHFNKTPEEVINTEGEEVFRQMEQEIAQMLGQKSGVIIATGGGTVTRKENYFPLKQNGVIFYLKRDISKLPKDGRPLSQKNDLNELYQRRKTNYEYFADFTIEMQPDNKENITAIINSIGVK